MINLLKRNNDYMDFIRDIKNRVQSAQIKAAVSVNLELMRQWYLFWADGEAIMQASLAQNAIMQPSVAQIKKSQQSVDQVLIAKQLATQIPWWHNMVIISKIKNHEEALFYVQKTIEFFKVIQNKLLWAISRQTAAELVYRRVDDSF